MLCFSEELLPDKEVKLASTRWTFYEQKESEELFERKIKLLQK